MITHGEDVEAHALFQRGWTISAIARHLDRDPKTIRAYINGVRVPGVRQRSRPDPLEPFLDYLTQRFIDDPQSAPNRAARPCSEEGIRLRCQNCLRLYFHARPGNLLPAYGHHKSKTKKSKALIAV